MEWILLINGVSPYLYFIVLCLLPDDLKVPAVRAYPIIFLIQLLVTIVLSIISGDKKRLAKVTMINKMIQIPYYIIFFVVAVGAVIFGLNLMGIGILFIPVFVVLDFAVFLSTMLPEEICTIKLLRDKKISGGKFVLYLIGNAIYVVDVVLSVLIYKEYKKL